MKYIQNIKKDYQNVNDLIIKDVNDITLIFYETLVDQDKINEYILKRITNSNITNIKNNIPSPNVKDIKDYKDLVNYLETGFTIILYKKYAVAVETKGELNRSISHPDTEKTLFGPKDSLVENHQINFGLIRRRVKSSHLKSIDIYIGRYTKNLTSILYIDDITNIDLVNNINKKLQDIDIGGLNDISELKEYLNKEYKSVFPTIKLTERPDVICNAILNGKVVLIMDNSPYALILPTSLIDYLNPADDYYSKSININYIKILRIICFLLSITIPALYLAITTYNQETIPTSLLLNFQNQRTNIPYPSIIELTITLFTCDILRESDIRFPSNYGSAISILGGLVLGSSAVEAGLVTPIIIIIVAITFISSLIFTDIDLINGIRAWRIFFILMVLPLGLYGFVIALIIFITNIVSIKAFNMPYFFPIIPYDKNYILETVIKGRNNIRSKILSKNQYKGDL